MKLRLGLALLVLSLFPSVLQGQSILQFPRVISAEGVFTGIAVGNPTAAEASVTFAAFQADGTAVGTPVTVTIPAGGQSARLFSQIFGVASFNGWVQATSATSGLTGFFVNGNGPLTDFDGAGSTPPGTDLVLPFVAEDSITRTEVTLVNVSAESASAALTLYAGNGAAIVSKDVTLPPRGLLRQTLGSLLGASDFSNASHLRIAATRPIVAHEVVADFQMPGTSLRRETGALSGRAAALGPAFAIPQFATGGGWVSLLGLVNGSPISQNVTVTAYREDGSLWDLSSNPKAIALAGNASLRATVGEFFGFPSETLSTGWIHVSAEGPLSGYIGFGNTLTPSFALVEATPAAEASRFGVFSQVAEGAGYYTGLAVVNPGAEAAEVEFYTLLADGSRVGLSTITLAPNERVSKLFRELLPASLQQVGGWGYVRSTKPVISAVLFGSTNGAALANVPQQVPAGDFTPPAQTTGAITGSVLSEGVGVAGARIALNGPVNTSTTTDETGRYAFTRLPAGQYKVVASRAGAVVVPGERTVTVDRNNVGNVDFTAGGVIAADAPTIVFVTPVSAFAGNTSLSVRVVGAGFTPASIVRINGQSVPTTFVNSTELSAVIPASLLGQPGTLDIAAETPPPGGGQSLVLTFTVNNAPSDPRIEGTAPAGSFPSGVAIDAANRRALVTNQSSDNVTVIDLATRVKVADIPVGRSPAEGIDIHPDKGIALVANVGSNNVSVIDLNTNTVTRTINVGRFPTGLAVNVPTNRAYVSNGEDNTLSTIDLDTFQVVAALAVGARPSGVAVNPNTNQGVVANAGANSVSVINLATGSVLSTIPVGESPRGVAINPERNVAVVANAGSNTISIIDLSTRTVVSTVNVGGGPTGVAIHRSTNSAIVTNSGVTRATPGIGALSSVSILNLDTFEELALVEVGSAAFGVAVDQGRQIAAVANYGANEITILRIPNPMPRITGVEPRTFPVGGGAFTITVRGNGFVPTSVVTLNGQPLPTVFVSSTELRATVSAALVDQLLQVSNIVLDGKKGTVLREVQPIEFNVAVENPGPGGGNSPPPQDPQATQIQPENPAPVLLSISPTEIQTGTTDLTLTLSGNNFNATSIVNFGGLQFSPVSSSLTSLTIVVQASSLVSGTVQVSVTNPSPGGGTTDPLPFRVNAQANPSPVVSSVVPGSVPAGSGAAVITVEGAGFIGATTGMLAGVTGILSGNSMSFSLPASQTANAGTLNGLISTPAPGGGTATFAVNVLNPAPVLTGFSPPAVAVGTSTVAIEVTGSNFVNGSQITLGGAPIPTVFGSATSLTGTVPPSLRAAAGTLVVGVTNPGPGGGSVQGGTFSVVAGPSLISIDPASALQGSTVSVTLTGANFLSGATVAVGGAGVAVGTVTVVNPTTITTSFVIDLTAAAGARTVTVATSGGTSNGVTFTIGLAPPTISAIDPASGLQGSTVSVTLTGANFTSGASVAVSGTGVAVGTVTVVNPTTITTSLSIDAVAEVGTRTVTVTTAGGSDTVTFSVDLSAPVLTSISPSSGAQGAEVSMTLTGQRFLAGASVAVSGTGVTVSSVTVNSSTSITAFLVIGSGATLGARNVTVTTSGGTSNALVFTVLLPPPTLTSMSPASGLQGTTVGVTLTGTNFVPGALVTITGPDVVVGTVNFVSATSLTTSFIIDPDAPTGVRQVAVSTPGGTSAPLNFLINASPSFTGSIFTGAVSTNWSDPANWLPAGVPTSSTDVLIPVSATRQPVLTSAAAAGDLTVEDGATLNIATFTLTVAGNVNAGNTIIGTGAGQILMTGTGTIQGTLSNVEISGTATFSDTTVINGSLTVSGSGVADVSSSSVTVNGSLSTLTFGRVRMQNASGMLTVNGTTGLAGSTTAGELTAGTLNVKGNFTAVLGSATFVPSGAHITVFNGTGPQTINVTVSNDFFNHVTVDNPAGVIFSSAVTVNGNVTILSGDVTGPGRVTIAGNLTDSVGGRWQVTDTTFSGTPTVLPSTMVSNVIFSSCTECMTQLSGDLTLSGNLTVALGRLNVNGASLSVSGDFATASFGQLIMQGVSDVLTVGGDATFGGADTSGLLTDGTLNVAGNFSSLSSSLTSFAPSGSHVTVLNGTGTQTVSMAFPGSGNQRFRKLRVQNPSEVVFSTNVQIDEDFEVLAGAQLTGGGTVTVSGDLITASESAINMAGVTLAGAMSVGGEFSPGVTTFGSMGPQIIQAGLGYQNVVVTGNAEFPSSSSTTVDGSLTVSGGSLDIKGSSVTVTGSLTISGAGVLRMQDAAGALSVDGSATFNGGSTAGLLTAGTLNVKGSFTTGTSSLTNFAASGTHVTVLNGTGSQTVNMSFPSASQTTFQDLMLSNSAGAVFNTNAQINGNFTVSVAAGVSGTGTVTVAGSLTTAAGSAVTAGGMTLGGAMSVGGTFSPGTTTFTGASQTIQSGLGYQNVVVSGTAMMPASSTTVVSGNLTVTSGSLNLSSASLTVNGNFATSGGGALQMPDGAGALTVDGSATFNGGSTAGLLTAGTLNVKGSFTAGTSSLTNFAASGTHATVLNGTGSQTVSMSFPGASQTTFQDLMLSNSAGAVFNTNAQINGNFTVSVAAGVSGTGTVTVAGSLTTTVESAVTVGGMMLGGTMTVGGSFSPGTTTFTGASQTIQSGLGYQNVVVGGTAMMPASSTTVVSGNLTVTSGSLNLSSASLTVNGNFATSGGGALQMPDGAGALTVDGSVTFNGGSTAGLLTAGTLNVKGSFTAGTSSLTNFAASGTHVTVLNGTGSQTVSMSFPGVGQTVFQDLMLSNSAGAVFNTNARINGDFTVTVAATVSGGGTVTVIGNLATSESSTVTLTGMTLGGNMSVDGSFSPGTTTFTGASQTIQSGLGYQNVVVGGTAMMPASSTTVVSGNLTVTSGSLNVSSASLTVNGNFATSGGGALQMPDGAGALTVDGSVTFNGGSTAGLLTAGTLNVKGSFTAGTSSLTNFAASGTHVTVLNGTGSQTVSVSFPGVGQTVFQDLMLSNSAGAVFNTNARINGDFTVTVAATVSGGGTVTVIGNLATSESSTVTLTGMTLGGNMSVDGSFSPGTTTFIGAGPQIIQPSLSYQNVIVAGTAALPASSFMNVTGSFTLSSGSLNLTDATLSVSGDLTSNATLTMLSVSTTLIVGGNANFNAGSTAGSLTAGIFYLAGNFTAGAGSLTSFAASGTHLTVLNGSSTQTVSMSFAGAANQRFAELALNNSSGVVFSTAVQVNGDVTLTAGAASGTGPVTIGGGLFDPEGGNWQVGATTFTGSDPSLPGEMSTNVTFTGAVALPDESVFEINGSVTVSGAGATLEIQCYTELYISGNFVTQSGGILKMTDEFCSKYMLVEGNATFDGGDTEGMLTGGVLELRGNLTVTNSSLTNFAPSDSHQVILNGTTLQTVSMASPGSTQQRFNFLGISYAFGMAMSTDLFVIDELYSSPETGTPTIVGNGRTLTVYDVLVSSLDLDHVLLVLDLNDEFPDPTFNNVTFRNYLDVPGDTRLTVRAKELESNFFDLNFVDGVPSSAILVDATDTDGGGFYLGIYTELDPEAAGARTIEAGGAFVEWFTPG